MAIGLLASSAVRYLIVSASYMALSTIGFVGATGALIAFGCAVAALILGAIGLRQIGPSQAASGIAVGLGIAGIGSAILTLVTGPLLPFLLY